MPYNSVADGFRTKNFVADFKRSAILHGKRPFCVFVPPLGRSLRATYDVYLTIQVLLIWQPSAGLKEKQSHTNKDTHSKLHYWAHRKAR